MSPDIAIMAVVEPIKLVIETKDESVEWLEAPNHPSREELGTRKVPFTREVYIEADDFREAANKKYKRLVLGKEVRLRNAYVVKAERFETPFMPKTNSAFVCDHETWSWRKLL